MCTTVYARASQVRASHLNNDYKSTVHFIYASKNCYIRNFSVTKFFSSSSFDCKPDNRRTLVHTRAHKCCYHFCQY